MKRNGRTCRFLFLLPLMACIVMALPPAAADNAMKLGIYVYENLEGDHTPSSTFGTYLGSMLQPVCKNIKVEDSVPLKTNETVRILDEETKDRKVVWTTLSTYAEKGSVDYPAITFADNDIKFMDLTWKVDGDRVVAAARKAGLTHCLIGTCTGYVTPPSMESAAGKKGLTPVTASVNVRLRNLATGVDEWMKNYRQVVPHTDHRIAFEQAIEMVAERIAKDLAVYMKDAYGSAK
jgi:hypothetical protein